MAFVFCEGYFQLFVINEVEVDFSVTENAISQETTCLSRCVGSCHNIFAGSVYVWAITAFRAFRCFCNDWLLQRCFQIKQCH